ncbi:MAG: ABC transporter substrate-binding protein [Verrucomicrobia bacterium]|nr:ABC transporter substrate-binding protein [Verrucomicrobiota bacterium]
MTAAFTGPTAELGLQMKLGIDIYFAKVNSTGGIEARPLKLIALDDQYEPRLAAPNMRQLIDEDRVLAIIGNVGTPTAIVTVPIANEKHVLIFGALSGAQVLRQTPPDRYVFNLRADYQEETAAMISGLLSLGIKPDEIAFFTQNDAYGDAGYNGAIKAINAAGYPIEELPHVRYSRNTLNVEEGLAELLELPTPPKAIIIVGVHAPAAKFIKLAKQEFPNTLFLNVSFVGSMQFAKELGPDGNGVIVTEVVPLMNKDLPAYREYQEDMKTYGPPNAQLGFISFEGFLVAKLFVIGLKAAAANHQLTREGIINTFENIKDVDIGIGVPVSFDKNNHQALHEVWPMIIENGQYVPLNWKTLKLKSP